MDKYHSIPWTSGSSNVVDCITTHSNYIKGSNEMISIECLNTDS